MIIITYAHRIREVEICRNSNKASQRLISARFSCLTRRCEILDGAHDEPTADHQDLRSTVSVINSNPGKA